MAINWFDTPIKTASAPERMTSDSGLCRRHRDQLGTYQQTALLPGLYQTGLLQEFECPLCREQAQGGLL